jgi:hypothetical protein
LVVTEAFLRGQERPIDLQQTVVSDVGGIVHVDHSFTDRRHSYRHQSFPWYNPTLPRTINQHQCPKLPYAAIAGRATNQALALTLEGVMILIRRGQAPAPSEIREKESQPMKVKNPRGHATSDPAPKQSMLRAASGLPGGLSRTTEGLFQF